MPQLKIQLSEWKSESAPGFDIYGYDPGAIEKMDDKVRMLRAKSEEIEGISSYTEWITEFAATFTPELQAVLGCGREEILEAFVDPGRKSGVPAWNSILEGGEKSEAACRVLALDLLAVVLGGHIPRESEVPEEPEEPGEPKEPEEQSIEATDKITKEDEDDDPPTDSVKQAPIIPEEFFGRGPLPTKAARALQLNPMVHLEWRRGLASAEAVLRVLGAWLEINKQDARSDFIHIGLALAEFQKFSEEVEVSRKIILPQAEISVPVEPPRHLLAGNPIYDNQDLTLRLAPFMADQVKNMDFRDEFGAEVTDGGISILMRKWSQTNDVDLNRLSSLFLRLRNLVRRPRSQGEIQYEDDVIKGILRDLGCVPIGGFASCWHLSGDKVVGARPVFHYRDGIFHKQMLQLSMVLGLEGKESVPAEFTDQILRRSPVTTWVDNGLVFVGYDIDDPRATGDMAVDFTDFMAFADELQVNLVRAGSVKNVEHETWLANLKSLPTRLEIDFERIRRHWRRSRQADEMEMQLEHESVEAARSVIGRADNVDDRNHLRATLVKLLFQRDPEAALAEIEMVEYGPGRHEAIISVLESAVESGEKDLLNQCFGYWLGDDALRPEYDEDCLPILELVAAGVGLEAVDEGYSEELSPAVRCDWLNFIFRRSPRSRHDPVWLTHLDGLTSDEEALNRLNLDRLSDLFFVVRRHEMPGRSGLLTAIKKQAEHSPFRAYYENRLDQPLHDVVPKAEN